MTIVSPSFAPSTVGALSYTDLRSLVEQYTENTYEDDVFAGMTRLAEQRIYNSVQLPVQRATTSLTMTTGNRLLELPSDFLSAYSVAVITQQNEYSYLVDKDVNFLTEAYPNPSVVGLPRYYALNGPASDSETVLEIIVAPAPAADYTVELNYAHYPRSVVDYSTTWLGDNFSVVLFNAVMVEAARFMKQEPDIVAMMDKEYAQSLALLKNLADGKNRQDTYRSGQVRNKVV